MTLLSFQLKALRYTHAVDMADTEAVRKLVIWLENMKIREYKIEDRKQLADIASPQWHDAFKKYLMDLECPVPPTDLVAAVHWLVGFALNLEYEDNADKLTAVGAPLSGVGTGKQAAASGGAGGGATAGAVPGAAGGKGPGCGATRQQAAFTDLADPQVVAAVMQLVRSVGAGKEATLGGVGTGAGGGGIVGQLQAAAQVLMGQVAPAVAGGAWTPGHPPRQALADVPLGFKVEDDTLRTAATALRLAFVRDLRQLQSQIDHALVEMQEYTANPKTDSSLGKVGR